MFPTDGHVVFCMKRVNALLQEGVTPVFVFDGIALPSKKGTNDERRQQRQAARTQVLRLLSEGRRGEAYKLASRGVEITPAHCWALMQRLKEVNVEYIVAPYEADAQLAYLCKCHYVDAVISEDSDLLAYG
eukprot:Platyproteum_vivax@DN13539_c0_g1_i1.p1